MPAVAEASLKAFLLPTRDTSWMDGALCASEPMELWFPNPPQNRERAKVDHYNKQVRMAQEICFECPVRDACLKDATERNEQHGIWGGVDFYRSARHDGEKVAS